MKFSEIVNRLTGISTPVGWVSWQPAELEIAGARRRTPFAAYQPQLENVILPQPEDLFRAIEGLAKF